MRRADRLFDILRVLRAAARAMPASRIAAQLEVSARTIYRDIASLQASGVPIAGEAGVGYVLRPGFDLPTLMFTAAEAQAIEVALALLGRTGDRGLQEAAAQVRAKVAAVLPERPGSPAAAPVYVSQYGAQPAPLVCMDEVRAAIAGGRKLCLDYRNARGCDSRRIVWPLGVAYYMEATLIGAWCELRADYRNFRTDRVLDLAVLDDAYPASDPSLLAGWRALHACSTA